MPAASDPLTALLRHAAIIAPDPVALALIRDCWERLDDASELVSAAERHGLSNLLARHLGDAGITLPETLRQQLTGLKIRHRRANRARMAALAEMLDAFRDAGIPCVVLKGAALVNLVYPSPELRPMGDIDVLVPGHAARAAQQCLRDLGYRGEDRKHGVMSEHHHLPAATRVDDGIAVVVEVHVDALSRDTGRSLGYDDMKAELQAFEVEGVAGHAPGDVTMLRHLCQHAFEPAESFKLVMLADIYGYAQHFHARIPWDRLRAELPLTYNGIAMLSSLAPPPAAVAEHLPPDGGQYPADAGSGYPPLSVSLARRAGLLKTTRDIFSAPDWWLHCYYGVPADRSLAGTRLFRHPVSVLGWLWRRARAGIRDRIR